MPSAITPGALLLEGGTLLPATILLDTAPYSDDWAAISSPARRELGKQLESAGWTFFYMSTQIRTSAFGFDPEKRMRTAVKRAVSVARLRKCNCLEIDEVATKSFLGVPYVSVSAHARHIQRDSVFRAQ